MKRTQILRTAISLLLLGGVLFCGCSKENDETSSDSINQGEDMIFITDGEFSEYKIVFSEKADSKLRAEAVAFGEAIFEATGVRLETTDDFLKSGEQADEKEILIGNTNREEAQECIAELGLRDYIAAVKNNKLIIAGGSNASTLAALAYVKSLIVMDKDFAVSSTMSYSVSNADISDYYYVLYPVSSKMTAKASSVAINNKTELTPQKIASEKNQINDFDSNWAYRHHARIGSFGGKIYAAWTECPKDEDTVNSRIMLSYTSDFTNWSTPAVLVENQELTATSCGFFHVYGDTLYFYYNSSTYTSADKSEKVSDEDISYYISTTDGTSWSAPQSFGLYTGSTAPQASFGGRLFLCRGTSVLFTDDPSGRGHWERRSISDEAIAEAEAAGARELCEGNFYQSFDGVIHMIMRADDGYLWQSESYDNGNSWSKIYKTSFTDDNAMSYFGKLPDGRIYYIGNPYYTGYSVRAPLMLCISEDGYSFDEQYILRDESDYSMQQFGKAKSGYYGYPEAIIGNDGYIYVVYSKLKEVIEVTRFKISDIDSSQAKTELDGTDRGKYYCFDSTAACQPVQKQNTQTNIAYDTAENALKVSGASAITLDSILNSFLDGTYSAEELPVIALRVKKVNYSGKYAGLLYWKTNYSDFTKFGSFRYANDEEYHTMILDLSELYCYASSTSQIDSVAAFKGNWDAFKITFGNSQDLETNSKFYIKWIAVYPSVSDAMHAEMLR